MKISTLRSLEGIPFGSPRAAMVDFGAPLRERTNRRGEVELFFADAVFRFATDQFVEVSFKAPSELEIDGEIVSAKRLRVFMKNDADYFESLGFAVAPTFGLAYDLEHKGGWTSVFSKGRWDFAKKDADKP